MSNWVAGRGNKAVMAAQDKDDTNPATRSAG